ncbi:hypothetical protein FE257_005112 [Aspergillus nanangensis]|uniref:Uncharacterized protein n=1 Tax=Aspergillus nanangensis TaxID=2582783 RepID=A0AAD4GNZ8_ASPNN|nr:hypothetical protein FE257_005112 [Aspergillus nanangensis]
MEEVDHQTGSEPEAPRSETPTQVNETDVLLNPIHVLFGSDGIATDSVTVRRFIKRDFDKLSMEVIYDAERTFYQRLHDHNPNGYRFFPVFLASGEIMDSSLPFPRELRDIVILSWVNGERVCDIWASLQSSEFTCLYDEYRQAVVVFREMGLYLQDPGRHNVFYDRETGRVTLFDFEMYASTGENNSCSLDSPEIAAIFRPG